MYYFDFVHLGLETETLFVFSEPFLASVEYSRCTFYLYITCRSYPSHASLYYSTAVEMESSTPELSPSTYTSHGVRGDATKSKSLANT
jgi:hypothetical protein